jgi:hypothetical protein
MRQRPVGPGIGGPYYAPMLRDTHSTNRTTRAIRRLPQSGDPLPASVHAAWGALSAAARRFGDRLVQVRQEQARAHIERTTAILGSASSRPGRDGVGVRYY